MCTVTFIPVKDAVLITHSRDEKALRPQAVPPRVYRETGGALLYPKDSAAGGSWVAISEHGNASVLLNGAFTPHTPVYPYRKSRGLCLLDITRNSDLRESFNNTDLLQIEPFTVILYKPHQLLECRWDGSRKHIRELDVSQPVIWSSATLYDAGTVEKRESWFREWLAFRTQPSQADIIDFHLTGGAGDKNNDFRMNRNGILLTVSMTAMKIGAQEGSMKYLDLQKEAEYNTEMKFKTNQVLHDIS